MKRREGKKFVPCLNQNQTWHKIPEEDRVSKGVPRTVTTPEGGQNLGENSHVSIVGIRDMI